ncbi:MAG: ABC transporter substrate-binding protein [Ndongobacter sp.]|nr:ABC transporter substrate-binding protein [Ndongobacter sp.]
MKKALSVLMSLALVLSLAACAPGKTPAEKGETAGSDAAAETAEPEQLDVVLDWYPNAVHAFLYEAQEKGYFAEQGLNVNFIFPSDASDPLTMPCAGKADIGLYYQEETIIAKANENAPVRVIGTVVQEPLVVVCSLKEKGITSPEQLVGKKIGYSGTPFGEVVIDTMLQRTGHSLSDVEMINVGFELMSSMTTKQVDATFDCFINHEIPALEKEGFAMDYMKLADYGIPNHYALVFVTGEKMLNDNKDKYTRFLLACQKGFRDMQSDPNAAVELILSRQNEENFPLDAEVEHRSMELLLPLMEKEGAPFLTQRLEDWQTNIDWLHSSGMIERTFDPAEIVVDLVTPQP